MSGVLLKYQWGDFDWRRGAFQTLLNRFFKRYLSLAAHQKNDI
ncbi:hypothetical protein ACI2KS_22275 [Pseudomonas sp. NPDC087358]